MWPHLPATPWNICTRQAPRGSDAHTKSAARHASKRLAMARRGRDAPRCCAGLAVDGVHLARAARSTSATRERAGPPASASWTGAIMAYSIDVRASSRMSRTSGRWCVSAGRSLSTSRERSDGVGASARTGLPTDAVVAASCTGAHSYAVVSRDWRRRVRRNPPKNRRRNSRAKASGMHRPAALPPPSEASTSLRGTSGRARPRGARRSSARGSGAASGRESGRGRRATAGDTHGRGAPAALPRESRFAGRRPRNTRPGTAAAGTRRLPSIRRCRSPAARRWQKPPTRSKARRGRPGWRQRGRAGCWRRLAPGHHRNRRGPADPTCRGQPGGRGRRPEREHLAAYHRHARIVSEGAGYRRHPAWPHPHIVVGERDDRRTGCRDAGIPRVREALVGFEDVPNAAVARLGRRDNARVCCRWSCCPRPSTRMEACQGLLPEHVIDRCGKELGPVVGADHH